MEMTFFDFCAAGCRAIGRGFAAFGRMLARMVQLTYRYWWVVLTLMLLALAAALYYTRKGNKTYKVYAVALLNGPTIQQFEQSCAPLRMRPRRLFTTYRVIDSKHDETADFIDFKCRVKSTDTLNVLMQDRLCLQFRIKEREMHLLPQMETEVLDFLNEDEAMQVSYRTYLANLREEVNFNHRQAQKLDSLTSCYYFQPSSNAQPLNYHGNGVNFYGDRRIHLFLDEIYEQHAHMQRVDYRLQLATAPVVLENHFAVCPKPVNGRRLCVCLFLLLGWIGGCVIAELIDKRKALSAWLKA